MGEKKVHFPILRAYKYHVASYRFMIGQCFTTKVESRRENLSMAQSRYIGIGGLLHFLKGVFSLGQYVKNLSCVLFWCCQHFLFIKPFENHFKGNFVIVKGPTFRPIKRRFYPDGSKPTAMEGAIVGNIWPWVKWPLTHIVDHRQWGEGQGPLSLAH